VPSAILRSKSSIAVEARNYGQVTAKTDCCRVDSYDEHREFIDRIW